MAFLLWSPKMVCCGVPSCAPEKFYRVGRRGSPVEVEFSTEAREIN